MMLRQDIFLNVNIIFCIFMQKIHYIFVMRNFNNCNFRKGMVFSTWWIFLIL